MASKSFNEHCYDLLRQIPKGRVTTYKALAEALGSKAYRAVGNAMNKNPHAPQVPCHRVVQSNGGLGGYAGGIKAKIRLLNREGVQVKNGKVELSASTFFKPKKIRIKPATALK